MPTWIKRRKYMATEQNAVRLQQTLRALAETSEVPSVVKAETTAREMAEHQAKLAEIERVKREAADARREADRRAEKVLPRVAPAHSSAEADRRAQNLRRGRLVGTLVLAIGVVCAAVGIALAAHGSWLLLITGVVLGLVALAGLQRMNRVAAAYRHRVAQPVQQRATASQKLTDFAETLQDENAEKAAEEADDERSWKPVQVPKPMYLSRSSEVPSPPRGGERDSHGETLKREAERSVEAVRAAERSMPSVGERRRVVQAPSFATRADMPAGSTARGQVSRRYADMGVVDEIEQGMNLDDVLKRRRAV